MGSVARSRPMLAAHKGAVVVDVSADWQSMPGPGKLIKKNDICMDRISAVRYVVQSMLATVRFFRSHSAGQHPKAHSDAE